MIFTNKHNAKLRSADCLILNIKSNFGNNGETKTYVAKAVFEDYQYLLLITDLKHEVASGLDTSDELSLKNLILLLREVLENQRSIYDYDIEKFSNKTSMTLGLITLRWVFLCEIIPEQLIGINEGQVNDGPAVIYNHFILPMMIVTLGFRQQFKSLVEVINNKEKEVDELLEITKKSDSLIPTRKHKTDKFDSEIINDTIKKFASQPLPVPPNTQSSCYDDCLPLTQEDLTSWQLIDSNNSALNSNTSTKKSLSPQKDKTISTQSSDQNDDEFYTNNKEFDETHRQEMQRRQELKLAAQKVTDAARDKHQECINMVENHAVAYEINELIKKMNLFYDKEKLTQ
ncbi:19793_t:CDS:2 [Entrophospora sp. SA101]|nr:19793_t:CDS:2 [Entrophospora sp. SA101]